MTSLIELNKYDSNAFEEWLELRLADVYGSDRARAGNALDFSEFDLGKPESMIYGIEVLFGKLKPTAKVHFRRAVGALLTHAEPDQFPLEGMKDLLLLVGITRAYGELIALEKVLGTGVWGEMFPELFTYALSVLKGLNKGAEAYGATKRLITCRHFPMAYVFDAYEVLIAGQPDCWDVDLVQLSAAMKTIDDQARLSDDDEQLALQTERYEVMADELSRKVSWQHIASGIVRLSRSVEHLDMNHPVGRILMHWSPHIVLEVTEPASRTAEFALVVSDKQMRLSLTGLSDAGELFFGPFVDAAARKVASTLDHILESESNYDAELKTLFAKAERNIDFARDREPSGSVRLN